METVTDHCILSTLDCAKDCRDLLGLELALRKTFLSELSQLLSGFQKLDAEVEYMVKSWETLRGDHEGLEVKEEDLSELLQLQKTVKDKVHQSESILDLSSSFHLAANEVS